MCDTQVLIADGVVWFAKNSDREPGEPQPVVRYAAVRGDSASNIRASHIEIPQVADRHGVLLSKPAWCWGAEMGVNDQGVAIGNEAIFSRHVSSVPALLGMDLVRLGLERAASAREAIGTMTRLLETHGQGGPAGFRDKSFCYDNSFLVADRNEVFVLETAGREWAAKRVERHYAISNQLSLGDDYEAASSALTRDRVDFAAANDTRLLPFFAGAAARRNLSLRCLRQSDDASFARMARHLRRHAAGNENPARGSNRDVCMHANGFIRRHQTTGSMIARLSPDGIGVAFTGTSAPCLSIFRPAAFTGVFSVLTSPEHEQTAPLWQTHEAIHMRALADLDLREQLRATRDDTEAKLFALIDKPSPSEAEFAQADRLAMAWQMVMLREALRKPAKLSPFWRRQHATV
ncbi:MAG TPA: C69 family dipeptidase [Nevskiaceae bacterium]|nr:C69 family dipeptidase [Nevskiaceae bacterium]